MTDDLEITEVSRRSGLPASTLRYYEERGLITPTGRRAGRRIYGPAVLDRLALVVLGRVAGFSLDEIVALLGPAETPQIDRGALSAKADELDAQIRQLTAMRDGLRHAAACPAPSHAECPRFRALLTAATNGDLPPAPPTAPRSP